MNNQASNIMYIYIYGYIFYTSFTYVYVSLVQAGDMLYLGYKMSALEAKQFGFVSEIYKHGSPDKIWNYLNTISKLSTEVLFVVNILSNKKIL